MKYNLVKQEFTEDNKITLNVEFEVVYEDKCYYVECYVLDQGDSDTYSVRVYETDSQFLSEDTEVSHCYLDSTGGGFCDEYISIYNRNVRLTELEDFIYEKLFNTETGLVKGF